jgi:hypothetical protein
MERNMGKPNKQSTEDRVIFNVALPQSILDQVDKAAASELLSRAAWARRVLARAVQEAGAHG